MRFTKLIKWHLRLPVPHGLTFLVKELSDMKGQNSVSFEGPSVVL